MSSKKGCLCAVLITLLIIFLFMTAIISIFIWNTKYSKSEVLTSEYGEHKLIIYMIGAPDWPFGDTHCEADLLEGDSKITEYKFDVANDGANASKNDFNLVWHIDDVTITIYGDEQLDEEIKLFFNGKVRSKYLKTKFGKPVSTDDITNKEKENHSNTSITSDNPKAELKEEPLPISKNVEKGYKELYNKLSDGTVDFEISFGAKESTSWCKVSENDEMIKYIAYDRDTRDGKSGLFIYAESEKNEDGSWSIVDGNIIERYEYYYEDK